MTIDDANKRGLQVGCPTCDAPAGQPCRSRMVAQGGKPQDLANYTHIKRRLEAMQVALQRQGG